MPGDFVLESSLARTILALAGEGLIASPRPTRRLLRRLADNAGRIALAHRTLSEMVARAEPVPAESEWLLDNYYIIVGVVRQVRDHLPRRFLRQLPVVRGGANAGLPRIYPLAAAIIGSGDGATTEAAIIAAIREYQQTTALTTGEVWAVPIMLRLAVLEVL